MLPKGDIFGINWQLKQQHNMGTILCPSFNIVIIKNVIKFCYKDTCIDISFPKDVFSDNNS